MAQGTIRKAGSPDSLKGQQEVKPVQRSMPSLTPAEVRTPDLMNSTSAKIARGMTEFMGQKFQEAANTQHEAAILDGQMAYQQGEAIENIEVDGNKWALTGYRVMNAQTLASNMLVAQEEMIRQAQYADDPEAFRAKFVNRMEQQIKGLDPQTARMVRETVSNQMPTLVNQHTVASMKYQEEESFKALEMSIDSMSRDPSQIDNLLLNINGGEGAPSAGLGVKRREQAIAAGVIRALDNDNPIAFQHLSGTDAFNNMGTKEQNAIRAAQDRYQTRRRKNYDEKYNSDMIQWERDVAAGVYESNQDSVDAMALIMSNHGITMTAAEAYSAYTTNQANQDNMVRVGELEQAQGFAMAQQRGDWKTAADISRNYMYMVESGGDPNALGPVIQSGANKGDQARGINQVMPLTARQPGFGIQPIRDESDAEYKRVGDELWDKYMAGNQSGYPSLTPWPPGDVEAAAVAYNAGVANALKWYEAGRDYSVLPKPEETQPYAKKILAYSGGMSMGYQTTAQKLANTEQMRKDLMAGVTQEQESDFMIQREGISKDLHNGTITPEQYTQQVGDLLAEFKKTETAANTSYVLSNLEAQSKDQAARDVAAGKEERREQLAIAQKEVATQEANCRDAIANPRLTAEQYDKLYDDFIAGAVKTYEDAGFSNKDAQYDSLITENRAKLATAKTKAEEEMQTMDALAYARQHGTVDQLSPKLQERYWAEIYKETGALVSSQKANLPTDQQGEAAQDIIIEEAIKAKSMPKQLIDASTQAMKGQIMDSDGVPNPAMVKTMELYNKVKAKDPALAKKLFRDEEALALAEGILELGGGEGGSVMEGMKQMDFNTMTYDPAKANEWTQAMVDIVENDVGKWIADTDVGLIQAWTSDADSGDIWNRSGREENVLRGEETRKYLEEHIKAEALRLGKLTKRSPKAFLEQAKNNILDRAVFLGDSIMLMPKDNTMKQQMFGDQINRYDQPDIENAVTINWLRQLSQEPGMDYISEYTDAEGVGAAFTVPRAVARGFVESVGGEGPRKSVQGSGEALTTQYRGVRGFSMANDPKSGRSWITIHKIDGTDSDPIEFDAEEAGRIWMETENAHQVQADEFSVSNSVVGRGMQANARLQQGDLQEPSEVTLPMSSGNQQVAQEPPKIGGGW